MQTSCSTRWTRRGRPAAATGARARRRELNTGLGLGHRQALRRDRWRSSRTTARSTGSRGGSATPSASRRGRARRDAAGTRARAALGGRPADLRDAEQAREGEVVEPGPGRDRLRPERRLHAGDARAPRRRPESRRVPVVGGTDARRPRPGRARAWTTACTSCRGTSSSRARGRASPPARPLRARAAGRASAAPGSCDGSQRARSPPSRASACRGRARSAGRARRRSGSRPGRWTGARRRRCGGTGPA